jgi:uncharacterized protein
MFRKFYPDEYLNSAYDIDFEKLYKEGYRGLLFDIDNTLVAHGVDADKRAKELIIALEKIGYQTCLISNNQKERVERFNKDIGTNCIYNAKKPVKKNYIKAMELMKTDLSNTVFIGDQLFTDVFGAKRIGMRNILVKPIDTREEIQIILKRYLERIVLHLYKKSKSKE